MALLLLTTLALLPAPIRGQQASDSLELLMEAREEQRGFERYRESRLRPAYQEGPRRCDDLVGRLCLVHGGDEEGVVPPEPPEVGMARRDLLLTLARTGEEIPGDRWILGQRVYYLAEAGRWREARDAVEGCRADPWWCAVLRGYLSQRQGDHKAAGKAFLEAFEIAPGHVEERFRRIRPLLDREGQAYLDGLSDGEREPFLQTLWVLSDPLYLVDGNDRLVEHWARVAGTMIREEAEQPYDLPWEADLEELLLRYGQETGWERVRNLAGEMQGRDTRSIVGHHQSDGRQFLPPTAILEEPVPTPMDVWHLEERAPFTAHVAPYAPEILELDAQVARFRRGDSLLVVAGYRPATPEPPPSATADAGSEDRASDPFGSLRPSEVEADDGEADESPAPTGPVEAGIFLVQPRGGVPGEARGDDAEGTWRLAAPAGPYVLGIEVLDAEGRRAWRARGGVVQDTLAPGLAAVSDPILLEAGEPLPESLEEALPRVLPSTRVEQGRRVAVAWEVYGLRPNESARITVGFTRHREGILRRLGEFLRVVETEEPIVVSFEDAAPDRLGTVFRAIHMELPSLEPGEYDLHVEVDLQGRDPLVSTRRITVGS